MAFYLFFSSYTNDNGWHFICFSALRQQITVGIISVFLLLDKITVGILSVFPLLYKRKRLACYLFFCSETTYNGWHSICFSALRQQITADILSGFLFCS